jgi:UPF0042 nucleotide-binding protein
LGVGIDARSEHDVSDLPALHAELTASGQGVEVLFLEAGESTLVRRYAETRRRHPLGELPEAIRAEAEIVGPLRRLSTQRIDTEGMTARELRRMVRDRYGDQRVMELSLISFGFKSGTPTQADLVFDARFLDNPFEVAELRPLSGFDDAVASYVLSQATAQDLLDRVEGWIRFQAPLSLREGRSYLTVAVGCTGGQHRSVALVEALGKRLATALPDGSARWPNVGVRHRDVSRDVSRDVGRGATNG